MIIQLLNYMVSQRTLMYNDNKNVYIYIVM